MREDVVKKFSKFFIICSVSSIYIPGLTKNEKRERALFFYCIFISLFPLFCALDEVAFMFGDVTLMDISWFLFLIMSFLWTFLRRTFFVYYGQKLKIIFEFWSENLHPQIWPEIRDDFLQAHYKKTLKKTIIITSTIVGPMLLVSLSKLFWTRLLFFHSWCSPTDYLEETHWGLILIQGIAVISLNFSWVTSEMFVGFLLTMIISEYHYLERSLIKILKEISISEVKGNIKDSFQEYGIVRREELDSKMEILRDRLAIWINYHAKVIRFGKKVEDYYVPLMAGSLLQITVAGCGFIVLAVSLTLPEDVKYLSYLYVLPRMFMVYRICKFGDEIITKSGNLGKICFHSDWVGLPKDIVKTLHLISENVREPASISISGHISLNSQTFRRIMYVQYRFLTFLQDMVHKKPEKEQK